MQWFTLYGKRCTKTLYVISLMQLVGFCVFLHTVTLYFLGFGAVTMERTVPEQKYVIYSKEMSTFYVLSIQTSHEMSRAQIFHLNKVSHMTVHTSGLIYTLLLSTCIEHIVILINYVICVISAELFYVLHKLWNFSNYRQTILCNHYTNLRN